MIRLHRDTGLQLLENKVLSRGITRKSACILAEITIRKSQGITFLDNTYGPEWSHKINWEALDINDSRKCILGQLEGRYEGALQKFNAQKVLVLTTVLCQVFGKAVRN